MSVFNSSDDKSEGINKSRWQEVALVALGSSLWSERLEDRHINTNQKELLWAKHRKDPYVPECVKTEFERSLKKLHSLSIPISLCSLDNKSSFFFPKCSTEFQKQQTDMLIISHTSTGLPDRCRTLAEHLWGKKKTILHLV